jgi:hypothetical protein
MRVIIGCEFSGVVRDAFIARGHDAISCDLIASSRPGPHHQGDILAYLRDKAETFDLGIFHPPCQYLAVSGLWRNYYDTDREAETERALDFVRAIMALPIRRMAIENPRSCISTRIRAKDQAIQPYEFGEDASKETWLWLKNLPRLRSTQYIQPRITEKGLKRWGNQMDCGNVPIGDSRKRAQERATTFQGIADAMADQWGVL